MVPQQAPRAGPWTHRFGMDTALEGLRGRAGVAATAMGLQPKGVTYGPARAHASLGKSLHVSEPQFPLLHNEATRRTISKWKIQ